MKAMRSCLVLVAIAGAMRSVTAEEDKLILAAGCFWSIELAFNRVPGVVRTSVGYAGGATKHPSYHQVAKGRTGHAEAVLVIFDPNVVSAATLMDFFFVIHDPTTLNRQGPDRGTQYRSAGFFDTEERRVEWQAAVARANKQRYSGKVVTAIERLDHFWEAEPEHQSYLKRNFPGQADDSKGSLKSFRCYGNRGPLKKMNKPEIKHFLTVGGDKEL